MKKPPGDHKGMFAIISTTLKQDTRTGTQKVTLFHRFILDVQHVLKKSKDLRVRHIAKKRIGRS